VRTYIVEVWYPVGGGRVTYEELIKMLSERVDRLPPRSRAAVFWLAGTALRSGLSPSESAGWDEWFDRASDLSVDFIVEGQVGGDVKLTWEQASRPTGDAASGLLNSAINCLSTPLAIALEPSRPVGPWVGEALFPVMQAASLDLFDDVAFPDNDDDLEEVLATARVQAACSYCVSIFDALEEEDALARSRLEDLLHGSAVLIGV
jgi:hypothetical protein